MIADVQAFIWEATTAEELRVNLFFFKNEEGELTMEYELKEVYTEAKFRWKALTNDMAYRMAVMGKARPDAMPPSPSTAP